MNKLDIESIIDITGKISSNIEKVIVGKKNVIIILSRCCVGTRIIEDAGSERLCWQDRQHVL
jgi:hypothetical protein